MVNQDFSVQIETLSLAYTLKTVKIRIINRRAFSFINSLQGDASKSKLNELKLIIQLGRAFAYHTLQQGYPYGFLGL
jgi:hypothetical protein